MKRINSNGVSQLSRELSSIDIQQMLLARAKNSVLEMAIDLLEQDMEGLCGKPFGRKTEGCGVHALSSGLNGYGRPPRVLVMRSKRSIVWKMASRSAFLLFNTLPVPS